MQITHEEAHRLIQFRSDSRLEPKKELDLSEHLKVCGACRAYSEGIRNTESILQQTMRKQWNATPLPLQMSTVLAKVNLNTNTNIFLTTRTALIGIAFVLFAFVTWQSVATNKSASSQTPLGIVPMIPTPSTQYTVTNTMPKDCRETRYIVQEGDTLESIARKFSVSRESILPPNDLADETLKPNRELVILLCESTPTSTMRPPTGTTTPMFEIIGTTPG